jgi:hypothetical protein
MVGRDTNYKWGLEITTNQRVYTVSVSDIPNCWHVSDRAEVRKEWRAPPTQVRLRHERPWSETASTQEDVSDQNIEA